jgi:hypothetical protein
MRLVWIGIAIASIVAGVAVVFRRRGGASAADVGSVSEGWLAEQRGRKEDH